MFSEMKEKAAAAQKYTYGKTIPVMPIEPYPITFRADTPSPVDLDKQLEKSGNLHSELISIF